MTTAPPARWRPVAKVRIQIRVENFDDDAPAPSVALPGTGSEAFGLGQEHQEGLQYSSIGYDIVPHSINIERNSYRSADEVRIRLPFKEMPFDPRLVRAATIQVYGGTIDAVTYAEAMDGPDAPGILLPDARRDGQSNELFRGFVDDWDGELSESDMIQLTARDLTAFFVDAELPETALKGIPGATALDDVIRLILFGDGLPDGVSKRPGLPGVKGVKVVNDAGLLPRLNQFKPPNWFDSKKSVKKGRKRSKKNVQKISYWDMMTDLCVAAGFIIYVRAGTKPVVTPAGRSYIPPAEVVITNPRTYYAKSTRFGDEHVPPKDVRQFIHGVNVDRLKIRRNFAGDTIPTAIDVRTFDTATGKEYSSRFPAKTKNNRPSPSGRGDREEVKVHIVRSQGGEGIQARLDAMAESIYQQTARGEVEIKIETKHLAFLPTTINPSLDPSRSGTPDESETDIFQLQAGDPIMVMVDKGDYESERVTSATLLSARTADGAAEQMIASGIRPDLARAVAKAAKSRNIQQEFRTQKLLMSYDRDRGWQFEIHAINYIDVRNAVENAG